MKEVFFVKFLVLGGSGIQGAASAWDLLHMHPDAQLVLAGRTEKDLRETAEWLDSDRVEVSAVDVTDRQALVQLIQQKSCRTVISSVPWAVCIPPVEAAVEAGAHFVDFGLYQNREFDDRMDEFDRRAREAGVTVIPSVGVAPGLTNMVAAHGAAKLDCVDAVKIYVGGIPEEPEPPLDYKAVWSLEGVWTQFFEECRLIRDGQLTSVDPCSELEELDLPQAGQVEAALTDGLGTLLHMYDDPVFDGVQEVFEKTIRHRGHYGKVKTLKACGLLDTEPVGVDGARISPREFLTALLSPMLQMDADERDMTVMHVRVTGTHEGQETAYVYDMVDFRDMDTGILSMGRTTGYTGSILAPMVGEHITQTGVVEPERLGADLDLFATILAEYEKRGIKVSESRQ